jgi:hypothetical protein
MLVVTGVLAYGMALWLLDQPFVRQSMKLLTR